jgi:four helix bundle protein
MRMKGVEERLRAWSLVDELVLEVYAMTRRLPEGAPEDLAAALRSAALRSALQIVRGAHGDSVDFAAALGSAEGSLAELRYYLYLARRLGVIDLRRYRIACGRHDRVNRFLRESRGAPGRPRATGAAVAPWPGAGEDGVPLDLEEDGR